MHLLHMFYTYTVVSQLYSYMDLSWFIGFIRFLWQHFTATFFLSGHGFEPVRFSWLVTSMVPMARHTGFAYPKKNIFEVLFSTKKQHPQGFFPEKKGSNKTSPRLVPSKTYVISLRPRCHGADPSEVETCEAGGPDGWWLMFGGWDSVRMFDVGWYHN